MNLSRLESAEEVASDYEKRRENVLLFQEVQIRHAFMRKVFSIVISQLILTGLIVAPMILHQPTRQLLIKDVGIYWASYVVFFAVLMTVMCCSGVARSWPLNYIMLSVLTIAMSIWVACICAMFDPKLVFMALGICLVVFMALYLFATQTAIDFTASLGIMFIIAIALIVLCILYIIYPTEGLTWILLIGLVVFVSIHIVIDIQLMMTGRHRYYWRPEDYIRAATSLYVDVVYLFLYILLILSRTQN